MDPLKGMTHSPGQPIKGIPLFCFKASDKISGKKVYINFRCSSEVIPPDGDVSDEQLVSVIENPTGDYKIPMITSPMFWTKEKDNNERNYGIYVIINERFALGRVISSAAMKMYLIIITLTVLEQKYNVNPTVKENGHFLGHKLDFEFPSSNAVEKSQSVTLSNEMVNNKIVMLGDQRDTKSSSDVGDTSSSSYDLYYRPASKILTCSVSVDKLPDSISFNDDHIVIKLGDKSIVDAYLPFYIDTSEPVRYKHDDRSGLFRAVFKIAESR